MQNLAGIDLNLLVILDAVLAERSVTRAAARVGLSQPAMSNALARLRALLDDPLLVRAGSAMEPTPRALELAAPIHQALESIRRTLAPAPSFDPRSSSHVFRFCSADDLELTLLPRLLEQLKRKAPGIDIEMRRVAGRAEEDLRTGRIDLYLGVWPSIPPALERHLLRQETFACIARKGHPLIRSRLTLEDFVSVGHVLVAPSGRPGSVIDTALSDQGLGRRVVLRTPHFSIAPLVVARSDLIATLPRAVAMAFAEVLPLRVYAPPLDTPGFPVHMVWHPRTHEQPPHRWMRQLLMDLAQEAW